MWATRLRLYESREYVNSYEFILRVRPKRRFSLERCFSKDGSAKMKYVRTTIFKQINIYTRKHVITVVMSNEGFIYIWSRKEDGNSMGRFKEI